MKKIFTLMVAAIMLLNVQNAGAWGFKWWNYTDANSLWLVSVNPFYPDGYTAVDDNNTPFCVFPFSGVWPNSNYGFSIYQNGPGSEWGGAGGQQFWCGNFSNTNDNTILRAVVRWDLDNEKMKCDYTVILPDGEVRVNGTLMARSGYNYTATISKAPTVTITGNNVSSFGGGNIGADNGVTYPNSAAALTLNVPNVPVTATSACIKVNYNLVNNQVTFENVGHDVSAAAGNWVFKSAPYSGATYGDFRFNNSPRVAVAKLVPPATSGGKWGWNYTAYQAIDLIELGSGFAYLVNAADVEGNTTYGNSNWNSGYILSSNNPISYNTTAVTNRNTDGKYYLAGNPFNYSIGMSNFSGTIKTGWIVPTDGTGQSFAPAISSTIPPFAGVIVQAANDISGTFSINPGSVSPAPAVRTASSQIKIEAANSAGAHYTLVRNNENGSATVSINDLSFFNMGANQVVQLYTSKNDENGMAQELGLNTVNTENATIPVSIFTEYTGTAPVTFTLTGMDSYDCEVAFVDNLSGESVDLTGIESYSFETEVSGSAQGRFSLVLSPRIPTSIEEPIAKVSVWAVDGKINIVSDKNIDNVSVYSIDGRRVYTLNVQNVKTAEIPTATFPAGVYMVKANGKTDKVIVK